jgi:hypothetical protein
MRTRSSTATLRCAIRQLTPFKVSSRN